MPCITTASRADVRRDLLVGANVSRWLFLRGSQEWAAETMFYYQDGISAAFPEVFLEAIRFHTCDARYQFLAALMQNGEYARAHYHSDKIKKDHETYLFIHYYAKYLDCERRRLEALSEPTPDYLTSTASLPSFRDLLDSLRDENSHECMRRNGPLQFLYGMLLSRLCHEEEAAEAFVASLNVQPMLWCAWLELLRILPPNGRAELAALRDRLPVHWMRDMFMAKTLTEFHLIDEAEVYISELVRHGFEFVPTVVSIQAQIQLCRQEEKFALAILTKLQDTDPLRLENFDTMSHLYFLTGQKEELARLAQAAITVDKWNEKTLCTVGNYYATRGEHEKAVVYFTRAVTVNPSYATVWVLIGHSYIELRNPQMAIKAYTYAVKANPLDCAGWYGVGQAYEIFKMPSYAIEYFSQAHTISPNDQRFLIALGDVYAKTDRFREARRAFWKAYKCRRSLAEGILPLSSLGNMFEKVLEFDNAAAVYTELICTIEKSDEVNETTSLVIRHDSNLIAHAYLYLAKHAFRSQDDASLEEALRLATVCRRFPDIRSETTALMQQISARQNEPKLDSFLLHNSSNNQRLTRAKTRRIAQQFKRTSQDVLGAAEAVAAITADPVCVGDDFVDLLDEPPLENIDAPMADAAPANRTSDQNYSTPTDAVQNFNSRFVTSTPGTVPLAASSPFSFSPVLIQRRDPSEVGEVDPQLPRYYRLDLSNSSAGSDSGAGNDFSLLAAPSPTRRPATRAVDVRGPAVGGNDASLHFPSPLPRRRLPQRANHDAQGSADSASSSDLSGLLDEFHIDAQSQSNVIELEAPADANNGEPEAETAQASVAVSLQGGGIINNSAASAAVGGTVANPASSSNSMRSWNDDDLLDEF